MSRLIFILFGPSGSGKTSLLEGLTEKTKNISRIITATDRMRRAGEINGKDYYFFTPENFTAKINKGYFAEWNTYATGCRYGIPKREIEQANENNDLITILDFDGVLKMKEVYGENRVVSIFIYRTPENVLKEINSRQISEEEKGKRIKKAKEDLLIMDRADYIVCNLNTIDDFLKNGTTVIRDARARL